MMKAEAKARKLFRTTRVGSHYEWTGYRGELHVIRVKQKRLTVGDDPCVEIKGVFFFLDKEGNPRGEGHPAGASCDGWQKIGPVLRKWKGKRPKRSPIHEVVRCDSCEYKLTKPEQFREGSDGTLYSVCCSDEVDRSRWFSGDHDGTCLCEECEN
jgi:hypothetical protein